MLLTMLRNPTFRSAFPKMNADDLKNRLRESSRLEAFRNDSNSIDFSRRAWNGHDGLAAA